MPRYTFYTYRLVGHLCLFICISANNEEIQSLQFDKQSQGGSIITKLINPNDFDTLSTPPFSFTRPPLHTSLTQHLSIQLMLPIICTPLLVYDVIRTAVNLQRAGSQALTPSLTRCLRYRFPYCANITHVFRYCYLFCMICFGKILLQDKWGAQQGRRMTDSHTDADMLFFTFPPIRRDLPATPFQLSAAMAFWVSVWSASLFPVQTESHRRKLCLPSWAPAVGALWSFKATETHVWYFCLYPDWTFQVHVKGTESLQT